TGRGTTTQPKRYEFLDTTLTTGVTWYRYQQFDHDGAFVFSNIVELIRLESRELEIIAYPNPVKLNSELSIKGYFPVSQSVSITMTDLLGRTVLEKQWIPASGWSETQLTMNGLSAGTYVLKVEGPDFIKVIKINVL
ncbi:MAG: T9SS type A sorting domain-containing protein, partial [Bacteroidia bacterium]|nr:T9SS type A sorting domain-containing protein [Bacteroidia bacterium]